MDCLYGGNVAAEVHRSFRPNDDLFRFIALWAMLVSDRSYRPKDDLFRFIALRAMPVSIRSFGAVEHWNYRIRSPASYAGAEVVKFCKSMTGEIVAPGDAADGRDGGAGLGNCAAGLLFSQGICGTLSQLSTVRKRQF
jgi:hypothetical protein